MRVENWFKFVPDGNELIPSDVLRACKLLVPVPPLAMLNGDENETVDEKVCGCVQLFDEFNLTYLVLAESTFKAYPPEVIVGETFGTKTPLDVDRVIGEEPESSMELFRSIFKLDPDISFALDNLFEFNDMSPPNEPPGKEKPLDISIFQEYEL